MQKVLTTTAGRARHLRVKSWARRADLFTPGCAEAAGGLRDVWGDGGSGDCCRDRSFALDGVFAVALHRRRVSSNGVRQEGSLAYPADGEACEGARRHLDAGPTLAFRACVA